MAVKSIVITAGEITVEAELNDSGISGLIWDALPLEATANTWGEEIYFSIPVKAGMENPVEVVEKGDIAYWGQGAAFCIFFGETPVSSGGRIIPASAVEIIGLVRSGLRQLSEVRAGDRIRVERKGACK